MVQIPSRSKPAQQHLTHQERRPEGRNIGVPTVVCRPAHVDYQHVCITRAQPIDGFPREAMPMDVAPDDQYGFVGMKSRERSYPR